MRLVLHHIPVCPFSQRIEILLALKGRPDAVAFRVVDITRPRPPELLALSRGSTALPLLEVDDRTPLRESRVILDFVEAVVDGPAVKCPDSHVHALESLIVQREGAFAEAGYAFVMNRRRDRRERLRDRLLEEYRELDALLRGYAPGEVFVTDRFGWAETVFTPLFQRFWFNEYYEDFALPETGFDRVRRWIDACLAAPAAGQVTREQIVKLYYDYALGYGNGALPEGRERSSFVFDPHWADRPMPPRDKWGPPAGDAALGLVEAAAQTVSR